MRVALFVHRYPPALGGAERVAERLAAFHRSCGDSLEVWTSTALDLTAMTGPGRHLAESRGDTRRYRPLAFPGRRVLLKSLSLVPHRPWQCWTRPANPVMPGMARDVHRVTPSYDFVHALAFPHSFLAVAARTLARRAGCPLAITPFLHFGDPADPRDPVLRQYAAGPLRWLLREADLVFAQTNLEKRILLTLGLDASEVIVQGLGVDPAEVTNGDRDRARQSWQVGPDDVVIGHLANLSAEKGAVDLLRAFGRLPPTARLVLAGPQMPNFTAAWQVTDAPRVTLTGPLTDAQRRDFFAGIDVFCLPSRSDSFGLVLLESWANGKPVVVYHAGGPAELVRHGRDGLTVRVGDVAELAQSLARLIESPGLVATLGATGQARIAAGEFTWALSLAVARDAAVALAFP